MTTTTTCDIDQDGAATSGTVERADALRRIGVSLDRFVPSVATWLAEALEEQLESDGWERARFKAIMYVGPCPGEWYSAEPEPQAVAP